MTTAPVNTPPMKRREMQEVQAPEMFQFSENNRQLGGVLLDISTVQVKEKETTQYLFQGDDGRRYTFLATYDLLRKIQRSHLGHFLWVIYEGEDTSVKTQGSPLRKFSVKASKEKEPGF